MNKTIDLRIKKTYKALTNALFALLEKKDFEDISVNELCELAVVGRGTFYKHFADKYEFLSFVVKEQYHTFLDKMLINLNYEMPSDYYIGLIEICMNFCEEFPTLISSWRQRKSVALLVDTVSEIVVPDITKYLVQEQKNGYHIPFEPHLTAEWICGTIMQTVTWWFANRDKIPKEELLAQCKNIKYVCG